MNKHARAKITNKDLAIYLTWNSWVDITDIEISAFLRIILKYRHHISSKFRKHNAKILYFGEIFKRNRFFRFF